MKFETDGIVRPRTVDGFKTTGVAIHDGHGRAIALIYAGHGDGQEVAQLIVRSVNERTELLKEAPIFLYVENTEGGSQEHMLTGDQRPTWLRGWMSDDCAADDQALLKSMNEAQLGEYSEHRLGVCIRVLTRPQWAPQ
ncbi:MAG TPA: hypothetical protein VGG49_13265 [Steroidobacteraceae bacterium]|jgi:hypothetical protein